MEDEMNEVKPYNNITFKKENDGFYLCGEDEKQTATLRVKLANNFPDSLCNLVRKLFSLPPKLKVVDECLELLDKQTGVWTEVIDWHKFNGLNICTYSKGGKVKSGEGDELLEEVRERLHFEAYQRHYEQLFKEN